MTTYFAGGELDSFRYTAGISEGGTNAVAGFSRGSIFLPNDALDEYIDCFMHDPATGLYTSALEVWTHFIRSQSATKTTGVIPLRWLDSAGNVVVRFVIASSGLYDFQYWNGSAFVNAVAGISMFPDAFPYTIDVRILVAASGGKLEIYSGGVILASFTGDTSGIGNIARHRHRTSRTGGTPGVAIQQVILASYPTLGHTVRRRTPTGNGANTAWLGDYTGVDEIPISFLDQITSAVVGDKETFTAAALSATPSGSVIKAVVVAANIRKDGAGPQNAKGLLRIGGTDYPAIANMQGIATSYQGHISIFENDPSTGSPWSSITNVNGEFGLVSET